MAAGLKSRRFFLSDVGRKKFFMREVQNKSFTDLKGAI